ncbi:uncharacterized protein PAC_12965 [Phialocephala subalpina]|uniref:Uncharacterized protein n=1 Tax=Phialocephala subalpina TaxID=576137 RepID=A0A1L7XDH8_9HELO|nr:uncharacterized protein PAC_12965 [Phialocephala subalpina]
MATPPEECNHTYLSQSIYGSLPPLYFSPSSPMTPHTLSILGNAYAYMTRHFHPRSPFEEREVKILREELEAGMSKDRREQMQYYVVQIQDLRKRKATEVYLARYPGFVMYGDGRLDYGLAEMDVKDDGHGESVMQNLKKKLGGWW